MKRLIFAAVIFAGACTPPLSASQQQWPSYKKAAQAILDQYDSALYVVGQADLCMGTVPGFPPGKECGGTWTSERGVSEIETKTIPGIEAALGDAKGMKFPTETILSRDVHPILVQALDMKLTAYKTMTAAYHKKDAALFDDGFKKWQTSDSLMHAYRQAFTQAVVDGVPPKLRLDNGDGGSAATPTPSGKPSGPPRLLIPGQP